MMMKNTMKFLAVAFFLMTTLGASAQSKPVKLGHIESNALLSVMPEMNNVQKELETKDAEISKEMQSLGEQYKKAMDEYTKNMNTYSDIVRKSKEQEIQDLYQRIQTFQELAETEFNNTREKLLRPVMEKANKAISDVAKENGFTYIFDLSNGSLLYISDQAEDILPLVKKKLGVQ